MKFIRLFCVVTAVLFSAVASVAQAPSGVFSCIEFSTSTACPLSGTPSLASLEGNTAQFAVGAIVSVSGYHAVADGGAGEYVMLGSPGGSPSVCNGYTNSGFTNVTGSAGSAALSITGEPYPAGLTVGEMVSGSGSSLQVQTGSEIASITFNNTGTKIIGISLTLPLTGMNTSPNVTITIAGNNTGTLILDSYGGGTGLSSNQCWQKINYRGDPHEFGAYGDGASSTPHDDTASMQNWFGAYGNVNPSLAPATAPNAFGPWIATVPATYLVSSPLTCPQNTTVQGTVNLTNSSPVVAIEAASGQMVGGVADWFSGTLPPNETASSSGPISAQAVIGALAYCRLTGISVVGNGYYLPTMGAISNGSKCISAVIATLDLQVGNYVAGSNVPPQTTVTAIGTCAGTPSVTLSNAISCTSCGTEAITFYGPDVVDVLANRVAIDGFSALGNGGNNLVCISTAASGYGLQVKNTEISGAMNDNIHAKSGCPNVRFIGDIVSGAGKGAGTGSVVVPVQFTQICGPGSPTCTGTGFYWSGDELTLADGVIEESRGIGLYLDGAQKVSVSAMHIQGNGLGQNGGAGIAINNSFVISVCGNHMEGNGGNGAYSAQVYFSGTLDSVNFCGNTYLPQSLADVTFRPQYVYAAATGTTVTNFHLYDAPAPQASGQVYSPNAALILPQLQVPHAPMGQISGLALSNASAASAIDIAPGEATDSTGSVTIELPNGCADDLDSLDNPGPGGLDTGTSGAQNTTYFYFAIASASGGNPNCIASTNLVPNLKHAGYPLTPNGETQNGVAYLYNLSSAAGLAPGQTIKDNDYMPDGTTINISPTAVGTLTIRQAGDVTYETTSGGISTISFSGGVANMGQDMAVSDSMPIAGSSCTPASIIPERPNADTIASVNTGSSITLTTSTGGPTASNDCITISGGNAVALTPAATGTSGKTGFAIYGGVYRLIGVLYTTASTSPVGSVVPFTQDGNTFYLQTPAEDINTSASVGGTTCQNGVISTTYCALSVPCGLAAPSCGTGGIKVEAFGRIVGGVVSPVRPTLVTSPDQTTPGAPSNFPGVPGYSTNSYATNTGFPFHLYTNSAGQVRVGVAAGSSGTPQVYEDTDGWVLDLANAGSVSLAASRASKQASVTAKRAKAKHPYRN